MASGAPFDPFPALGIDRDASPDTIKARYRELARRYHPNRHQGSEDSKRALAEQFNTVHAAWKHLAEPHKRRRCLELLKLAEEHDSLLARMADLMVTRDQSLRQDPESPQEQDGHVSSDADEDQLPHVGPVRRQTTLGRAMTGMSGFADIAEPSSPTRMSSIQRRFRGAGPAIPVRHSSTTDTSGKEGDYFALRRKKLQKLRREELAAFERYRFTMLEKFEVEFEAERQRELYERALWKREYFERAPRETAERLRSFQQFMSAFRAFGQQQPRRRNRSSLSYSGQILTTEEDADGGQYLAPDNARTKTLHRRGWSSDISGDQTSSDDNSSGGHKTPSSTVSWTWHRSHSRNTSLDAFQLPVMSRSNGSANQTIPEHTPFTLLVKRPTGFAEQPRDPYSSPESPATSRSPSPQPAAQCPSDFTLVQSRRFPEIFGGNRARDSGISDHETSPKRRPNGTSQASLSTPTEPCHFKVVDIGKSEHLNVPFDNVHEMDYSEKAWMLGAGADTETDPAALLTRLGRLDTNVVEKFMVKPDIKESFRFRLIYSHREVIKAQRKSTFIALSYRRKLHVERRHGHFTLPLDPDMFQAVWDERQSDAEGVWIDQICINQESREETTTSMSAMDMVYRGARLVVVALDDIELNAHERDILENHMNDYARMLHVAPSKRFRGKQPPYLETREELYNVLRKILRSSWFKRAWCRHEMRLARDHVFLLPCRSPGTWTGKNIIRFTGKCLTHLLALAIEVPFESDIELVKPPLHAFFRDRSKLGPEDRRLHSHHGNFTTVLAEVFGMEAGGDPRIPAKQRAADALKDKISIILNTMECGLALTAEMRDPGMPLTKPEGHYMLLLLALAAQDPGALCSVGPPMRLVQADTASPLSPSASSTWLFEPTNVDSGLNNYRTLNRIPASSDVTTGLTLGEHFVRLDLKFLQPTKINHGRDSADLLDLAHHFLSVCESRKLGRNRKRYLLRDPSATRHFGNMHAVYVETLACVFACGPSWLEEICHRYGVSRWKQDGESAWNLLVALKSTDGRWPESAWSAQAAGFIVDFVNFLVIRGMPQRQIIHREEWRPVWVAAANGGKALTFVPPGNVKMAVPAALLDEDYVHLARLWVLEARESHHHPSREGEHATQWTLLGKSVLFTDDLALEQLHSEGGDRLGQQQVFGREDPEIQRLLRERSLIVL